MHSATSTTIPTATPLIIVLTGACRPLVVADVNGVLNVVPAGDVGVEEAGVDNVIGEELAKIVLTDILLVSLCHIDLQIENLHC